METSDLHLINVSLPLFDSSALFEIHVANGRYTKIARQDGWIDPPNSSFQDLVDLQAEPLSRFYQWDAKGKIMLPGLVDSHMHLDKAFSLPKVPNESGTLVEAVRNYRAMSPSFTLEEIKARMYRAALQALSYGTTHIRTHVDFNVAAGQDTALRNVQAAIEVKESLAPYLTIEVFPMCPYEWTRREVELVEEAIQMGVDGLGGAPHLSSTPEEDIDHIFHLAAKHDLPIDLHTDESDDPQVRTVAYIAKKTEETDYQGRVVVDHLCSLSAMDDVVAGQLIEGMVEARLGAVTLPGANMYLQGRSDRGLVRRGVTRVRELLAAGIPVATASDNIHDPFHPFGRGDLLVIALLTAYATHMGSLSEQLTLLKMITDVPASLIGSEEYGIACGRPANFVILDVCRPEDVLVKLPEGRWVYGAGRWISVSQKRLSWGISSLANRWNTLQSQQSAFNEGGSSVCLT
ncbi:amidohydrolase family protein [Kyrpidia sp.]|uniref:amidohydrolase family protein n=1 Tax=Kyrpidia sp. TaxID=2073077 RepID=UPI002582906E|nr:amidohydrolase family protein [Kyrpidia sp.]MCL6576522.1 amidohydrolase family protein [Kyrpidia sp.]